MGVRRQLARRQAREEQRPGWRVDLIGSSGHLPRMSDTLGRFAEPLTEDAGADVESWQIAIDIAALVWNSVVCGEARELIVDDVDDMVGHRATSEDIVDLLTARKLRLFPDDRRLVIATTVSRVGRCMHVTASSMR